MLNDSAVCDNRGCYLGRKLIMLFFIPLIFFSCANEVLLKKEEERINPRALDHSIKSFRDQEKLPHIEQRQYQRVTRERLERENDLYASAGSMWVMDGQRSYLFAQNKMRNEGDAISVRLEGALRKQAEIKVSVIKSLLEQIELENKKYLESSQDRRMANANGSASGEPEKKVDAQPSEEKFSVDIIPSKVAEKMNDGNYRIRGQQTFMLGSRQFKVVLTGIIRPDDFSDDGVTSDKLIEPELDVLSVRKNKNEVL